MIPLCENLCSDTIQVENNPPPAGTVGSEIAFAVTLSAKPIIDIYRWYRYIAAIVNIDHYATMKQILTTPAQLGQIIATRRRAAKLSQSTLAAQLAISQNRLSEIEANPSNLTVQRLVELANLLGFELVIQDRPPAQRLSKTEW